MKKAADPRAAPAQLSEEMEQFQPPQKDAGQDQTEVQDRARGCCCFIDLIVNKFRGTQGRDTSTKLTKTTVKNHVSIRPTEHMANTDTVPTQCLGNAPSLAFPGETVVSDKVLTFVRKMHQRLTGNMFPDARLLMEFLRVTDSYPAAVVFTLLHCAPSCDRAAAIMWQTIASCVTTTERVLPALLCVMEDWPWHSISTSDGDNTAVFALTATRVVWEILQMTQCPRPLMENSPGLLTALLFQVFISTEQMPEEVNTFWRRCWEEHPIARNPNRFAVLTMKALLYRLQFGNLVMAMERKQGWDTLLNSDTHHYAVGLLAREMRRAWRPLCSRTALCLLGLLSKEKHCCELPTMAFLVEALDCLDMSECGDSILQIFSRHLQSECPERRRLALRGLVVLSKDLSMAEGMRSLTQSLLELLGDADGELVAMTLSVFINEVQDRDIKITIPTALQMAPALQPLFDNDNTHVQQLSIHLFLKVMELVVDEGKKALKTYVNHSLLPLFFHGHDKNRAVAEASREALLCAATFLSRRDLVKTLKTEEPLRFSKCLLARDRRRAAESLRQALAYLESPQEPLREAALRFIEVAAEHIRGQQEELQLICEALQAMRKDDCPSHTSVMLQNLFDQRAALLSLSFGSSQPVSLGQHQTLRDRRPPGDQRRRPSGAPGTNAGSN
ncbi:maestro heat-like repeat-containing protein family member 7 [Pithys albifrons albifrons]|uniref:maestro heat-like repeat-containing protein family member 7 n=1 Tax=Pithys albifrons albifrons TaxID=3385563 RepID=UPI003A5CDF16